jgi:hypothetical protein
MRQSVIFLLSTGLVVSLFACSTDPEDPPRFRIRNDRSTKASVQIKTSGGNTININDVQPGQMTGYQDAAAGQIEATASVQGESVSPKVVFNAQTNGNYTVVITNTTPPTLNVISP